MKNKNIQQLIGEEHSEYENPDIHVDYMDDDVIFIEKLELLPELYEVPRTKINIIIICIKGNLECEINNTHYAVPEGGTLVCPSGVVLSRIMTSPDFKFSVLCLTDRIIQSLLNTNVDIWHSAVYIQKEHVLIPPKEVASQLLAWHMVEVLHGLIKRKTIPFRKEMLHCIFRIILLGLCCVEEEKSVGKNGEAAKEGGSPRGRLIFQQFMQILREEENKHQPVRYYADKLFISSKYLSHICKETSGKSANEFIQMTVVEEITNYLKNSTLTVKEISTRMGFPNISFFGKYVKARLGVAPNEYRKQLYLQKG